MKTNGLADRGESLTRMEPMRLSKTSRHYPALCDLALELATQSAGLRRSLPQGVLTAVAELVRAMNCYYSNLIEGHHTHPVDIERALNNDYSANPEKRNLQLEAKSHMTVQQWLDTDGLSAPIVSQTAICDIHRRFGNLLPHALLWIENPKRNERIQLIPGKLRERDVKVGQHIAISPGAVPRFLAKFEQAYAKFDKLQTIINTAAAHHRLLWIHPFLDGNGRVARLFSHAMLREALDTGGIWSIARGLARQVQPYKSHLANCDLPRRNDLDGRGQLSEESLTEFTQFFLKTCLDQVIFMGELLQPTHLSNRILLWAEESIRQHDLPPKSDQLLGIILDRGERQRGEIPNLLDVSARHARRITATLIKQGILVSPTSRAPLRLAFPAKLADRWLPGLFPPLIK